MLNECGRQNVILEDYTAAYLEEKLHFIDNDQRLKRVILNLKTITHLNLTHLGSELDKFLMTRPWWKPMSEPYIWHKTKKHTVILDRYHIDHEKHLRYLAAIQYPGQDKCDSNTMLIAKNSCMHPGSIFYNKLIKSLIVVLFTF